MGARERERERDRERDRQKKKDQQRTREKWKKKQWERNKERGTSGEQERYVSGHLGAARVHCEEHAADNKQAYTQKREINKAHTTQTFCSLSLTHTYVHTHLGFWERHLHSRLRTDTYVRMRMCEHAFLSELQTLLIALKWVMCAYACKMYPAEQTNKHTKKVSFASASDTLSKRPSTPALVFSCNITDRTINQTNQIQDSLEDSMQLSSWSSKISD